MTLADFAQVLVQDTANDPGPNPDAEALDATLQEAALMARRCGVVPTLNDLANATMRRAWLAAAEVFDVEQATRIGLATQGLEGLARVLSEVDGGDALSNLLAKEHATRVAAELMRDDG